MYLVYSNYSDRDSQSNGQAEPANKETQLEKGQAKPAKKIVAREKIANLRGRQSLLAKQPK